MRKIDKIIIHHSASKFGNGILIDKWHRDRGFDSIGYHFIVLNGKLTKTSEEYGYMDGQVEFGRSVNLPGAHCYGHNRTSIGICCIGNEMFTQRQLEAMRRLVNTLCSKFMVSEVGGHRQYANTLCPVVDDDILTHYI